MRFALPRRWQRTRYAPPPRKSEEREIGMGMESEEESEDEGEGGEEVVSGRGRNGIMGVLWVVLSVVGTLGGRRMLRGGFGYPFYFTFLLQLAAYIIVAITVLLVRAKDFRGARRKEDEKYTWGETFIFLARTLVSSAFAGPATLCAVKALMLYDNLPVLAMFPILTYACDSLLFRLAYVCYLLPRGQTISFWRFPRVILVLFGGVLVVYQDYRLDQEALLYALSSFGLFSLSKLFSRIGPKIESRREEPWESFLLVYLLAGIIPLIMSGFATAKLENMVMAGSIAQSWSITYRLFNLGPPVALLAIFGSSINAAYPFISEEHIGGALEEPSEPAREAVTNTLHSGFWILTIGVLSQEYNFIDWLQVIAFTLIYVVCVGPKHIGYYPPRVLNLILRLFRRRPLPIHAKPWQFPFFLATTTLVFAVLISTNVVHWVDTIAYDRSVATFHTPPSPNLDQIYRPPKVRSFEVVIAHSAGDPIQAITALTSMVQYHGYLNFLQPTINLYSQDAIFNTSTAITDLESLKGPFTGQLNITPLPNTGGPTAALLHHILYSWDWLPVQTLFLSTSSITANPPILSQMIQHINQYFTPMGFPLPDALPKTGFLALGPLEPCSCTSCIDSLGWEDSFHLLASMFGAANKDAKTCETVLLTYGNNFFASAARLRGLDKDVYQLLYDALMKRDTKNSWAHAKEKLPTMKEGERRDSGGRWGQGGVYEREDSLEAPWLGKTVERLWGVLLQCSEGRIAWGCAGFGKGRLGGVREDCGCSE
ncbi:hypothetical protein L207DRAFT_568614 [Hyaloscypha variabilis F]|uniref:Uncharacterized protein n=1 Tax=Hyaloscypha variabilis (strain UAMH 11265 / GT02V1 / F) TaxID=1149755 RepID=A0A2J6RGP6_HYAVF|nr:hypothetical protein L207DRAFT_568614 [Hyaloscypha variabilis F]